MDIGENKHQIHLRPYLSTWYADYSSGWSSMSTASKEVASYDTWKLIPATVVSIVPPKQKLTLVDIPGASAPLDMSTSLTGYPLYEMREGTLSFYMNDQTRSRELQYHDICRFFDLYMNKFYLWLDDDPDWFYTGRVYVDSFDPISQPRAMITLSYSLEPYKRYKDLFYTTMSFSKSVQSVDTLTANPAPTLSDFGTAPVPYKIGISLDTYPSGVTPPTSMKIGHRTNYETSYHDHQTAMTTTYSDMLFYWNPYVIRPKDDRPYISLTIKDDTIKAYSAFTGRFRVAWRKGEI